MKLLTAMTALGAIAIAAPAAAQSGYQNQNYANVNAGGAVGIGNRIANLDTRFQAGIQSGAITRSEAQNLRPQLRDLRRLERQYSANGLTRTERQDLQARVRNLRQQLRLADNDAGNRYTNWRDDDDGYYAQGGPYEPVEQACERRSGIGGLISGILGGGRDCLEVGERVSGNLYGVPAAYRNQFRDGYGYYYRSDGQNIYQIDARTQTVLRVYPMNR
jgi:hypothetical protein